MTSRSVARSSVKSCRTRTAPPLERHDGQQVRRRICGVDVLERGAVDARTDRPAACADRSKYRTSRRRSRNRASPAAARRCRSDGRRHAGRGRRGRVRRTAAGRSRRAAAAPAGAGVGQTLVLDKRDLLRLAVFGDDEVPGGEAFDRAALRSVTLTVWTTSCVSVRKTGWSCRWACAVAASAAARHSAARWAPNPTPRRRTTVPTWPRPSSIRQNLTRRLIRRRRMSFARVARPNCGLVTSVFTRGVGHPIEQVRRLDPDVQARRDRRWGTSASPSHSRENCAGPLTELRPAVPHSPGDGGAYAAGLR